MIAIKKIRDNQSLVEEGISKKGESIDLSAIVKFDSINLLDLNIGPNNVNINPDIFVENFIPNIL